MKSKSTVLVLVIGLPVAFAIGWFVIPSGQCEMVDWQRDEEVVLTVTADDGTGWRFRLQNPDRWQFLHEGGESDEHAVVHIDPPEAAVDFMCSVESTRSLSSEPLENEARLYHALHLYQRRHAADFDELSGQQEMRDKQGNLVTWIQYRSRAHGPWQRLYFKLASNRAFSVHVVIGVLHQPLEQMLREDIDPDFEMPKVDPDEAFARIHDSIVNIHIEQMEQKQ